MIIIHHCKNTIKKSDVSDKLKKLQIKNLEKEMITFNEQILISIKLISFKNMKISVSL